jgi:hypothetical protein
LPGAPAPRGRFAGDFTIGFLALVERLFGAKVAKAVERRLETERPPPVGGV